MIIMNPTIKDLGVYNASLTLKSLIAGDEQYTSINIVVKDPNPPLNYTINEKEKKLLEIAKRSRL